MERCRGHTEAWEDRPASFYLYKPVYIVTCLFMQKEVSMEDLTKMLTMLSERGHLK